MKRDKNNGKSFGIARAYTPERLLEGLNNHWHRFHERTHEIVEMILRANEGRASAEIAEDLAKKIEVYDIHPNLKWDPLSAAGWSVGWNIRLLSMSPEETIQFNRDDHRLLGYLFEAGAQGDLRKFRRCAWQPCSRWFFQKREDQVYHSPSCKQKGRNASPEYREKQRRIMRMRYRKSKADALGLSLPAYDRRMLKKAQKREKGGSR